MKAGKQDTRTRAGAARRNSRQGQARPAAGQRATRRRWGELHGRCLLRVPGRVRSARAARAAGAGLTSFGRGKGAGCQRCGGAPPGGPPAPEMAVRGGNPRTNRNPVFGPFFHRAPGIKFAESAAMASAMAFSALFRRLHRAVWLIPVSAAICDSGTPSSRFRPISAGLGAGEDPVADGGGQDEVRVAPGQVRAVAPVGEVAAAGGVAGVGVGVLLPGPPGRPAQPGRQRHGFQVVQVQGAHGGQEPGQDLGLQVSGVAAVGGGQAADGAAQARHGDAGQADRPGRVAGAGAADQLGPHGVAGAGAGRGVQQQHPQLIERHRPVRQAGRDLGGVQRQRLRAGAQQPERGVGGVEGLRGGGVVIHAEAPGERGGRERSPIQPSAIYLACTCDVPRAGPPRTRACTCRVPAMYPPVYLACTCARAARCGPPRRPARSGMTWKCRSPRTIKAAALPAEAVASRRPAPRERFGPR